MAVFTEINQTQLNEFLKSYFSHYSHYQVTRFEGITAGIENSNFWLDVNLAGKETHWVLTVFEMSDGRELPAIVRLMQHLAINKLPVPAPVNDQQGAAIRELVGKPSLLVPKISGQHVVLPEADECQQVGRFLGRMHQASQILKCTIPLGRDIHWLKQRQQDILRHGPLAFSQADQHLLNDEIKYTDQLLTSMSRCPTGWIHGDLFVDNAMFNNGKLAGVIDFYHACHDHFINDLSICCNDWCYRPGKGYQSDLVESLISGYQQERQLSELERKIWPDALRLNALRFWVSRLVSKYTDTYQRDVLFGQVYKDPDEIKQKLLDARTFKSLI